MQCKQKKFEKTETGWNVDVPEMKDIIMGAVKTVAGAIAGAGIAGLGVEIASMILSELGNGELSSESYQNDYWHMEPIAGTDGYIYFGTISKGTSFGFKIPHVEVNHKKELTHLVIWAGIPKNEAAYKVIDALQKRCSTRANAAVDQNFQHAI